MPRDGSEQAGTPASTPAPLSFSTQDTCKNLLGKEKCKDAAISSTRQHKQSIYTYLQKHADLHVDTNSTDITPYSQWHSSI